jgi:hypothetical protein
LLDCLLVSLVDLLLGCLFHHCLVLCLFVSFVVCFFFSLLVEYYFLFVNGFD